MRVWTWSVMLCFAAVSLSAQNQFEQLRVSARGRLPLAGALMELLQPHGVPLVTGPLSSQEAMTEMFFEDTPLPSVLEALSGLHGVEISILADQIVVVSSQRFIEASRGAREIRGYLMLGSSPEPEALQQLEMQVRPLLTGRGRLVLNPELQMMAIRDRRDVVEHVVEHFVADDLSQTAPLTTVLDTISISCALENAPLSQVFHVLSNSGLQFVLSPNSPGMEARVAHVRLNSAPLQYALDALLAPFGMSFELLPGNLILVNISDALWRLNAERNLLVLHGAAVSPETMRELADLAEDVRVWAEGGGTVLMMEGRADALSDATLATHLVNTGRRAPWEALLAGERPEELVAELDSMSESIRQMRDELERVVEPASSLMVPVNPVQAHEADREQIIREARERQTRLMDQRARERGVQILQEALNVER